MLRLSYATLNSVRKRGAPPSTGSNSSKLVTAGASRQIGSSSRPSMMGARSARVATTLVAVTVPVTGSVDDDGVVTPVDGARAGSDATICADAPRGAASTTAASRHAGATARAGEGGSRIGDGQNEHW